MRYALDRCNSTIDDNISPSRTSIRAIYHRTNERTYGPEYLMVDKSSLLETRKHVTCRSDCRARARACMHAHTYTRTLCTHTYTHGRETHFSFVEVNAFLTGNSFELVFSLLVFSAMRFPRYEYRSSPLASIIFHAGVNSVDLPFPFSSRDIKLLYIVIRSAYVLTHQHKERRFTRR